MALIEGLQTKVEPIKIYIRTYSLQCTFLRNKIEDVQVHTRCMMRTWVIHCTGECVFLGAGVCIRCTYKHWTIHGVLGVCHERRQINWNIIAQTTQSAEQNQDEELEKIENIFYQAMVIGHFHPCPLKHRSGCPPSTPHNFIIILVSQ